MIKLLPKLFINEKSIWHHKGKRGGQSSKVIILIYTSIDFIMSHPLKLNRTIIVTPKKIIETIKI
jgi:hypothetical protein